MKYILITQEDFNKTNKALSEAFGVEYEFISVGDQQFEINSNYAPSWNKGKKGLQVPWNKGIPNTAGNQVKSQEMKDRISKTLMGHPVSEETRKKMSDKKKGKKLSIEHKKKLSEKMKLFRANKKLLTNT
jgi:hypothetical protein